MAATMRKKYKSCQSCLTTMLTERMMKSKIFTYKYFEVSMVALLCLLSKKTSMLPVLFLSSLHTLDGTTFFKKVVLEIHSPGNAKDFYTMHFTCCSIELISETSQEFISKIVSCSFQDGRLLLPVKKHM